MDIEAHPNDSPIQTRSEESGLHFFTTVRQAHDAWIRDPSIWKISWRGHRFCCKYKGFDWGGAEEQKLATLSQHYRNAPQHELFWVDQPLLLNASNNSVDWIVEVLTDEQFQQKYC